MKKKTVIMDETAIRRAATRITYEMLERNHGATDLCLVGIVAGGVVLGQRIADKIEEIEHIRVPFAPLDITPNRDDRKQSDGENHCRTISFDVQDKRVIIVDDVLYTGRSCRAAIDAILAVGRPRRIQLAVLIDRGHRELPIRPDYIGKNVPTSRNETVRVFMHDTQQGDCAAIYETNGDEIGKGNVCTQRY